jgi:hypothetical protein
MTNAREHDDVGKASTVTDRRVKQSAGPAQEAVESAGDPSKTSAPEADRATK